MDNDTQECKHETVLLDSDTGEWRCLQCTQPFLPIADLQAMISHYDDQISLAIKVASDTAMRVTQSVLNDRANVGQDVGETTEVPKQPYPFLGTPDEGESK